MKTLYDDPRLTAYVLGELPPKEREKLENELAASPELARAVEEMKESASLFGEALPLEAADLGLSYAQREAVRKAMTKRSPRTARRWDMWFPRPFTPGWSLAGVAVVVSMLAWMWFSVDGLMPETASNEKQRQEVQAVAAMAPETSMSLALEDVAQAPEEAPSLSDPAHEETAVLAPEAEGVSGDELLVASGVGSMFSAPPPAIAPAQPASVTSGPVAGSGAPSLTPQRRMSVREDKSSSVGLNYSRGFRGQISDGEKLKRDEDPSLASARRRAEAGNEAYAALKDNPFKRVTDVETGTSTFGADVDTASYSNVRRFLQDGQLPPRDAVRIEELLNYFTYDYPAGEGKVPFATSVEIASAPWAPQHRLVRVGIRAKDVAAKERAPMNLVFLVDVSGSMSDENKLPLVQKSLRLLTRNLEPRDRVAIVVYAGSSGLVLDSTSDKRRILEAIDRMQSGGSTNGAGGIRQAYEVAREHFIRNGINRVILCTDGDFNVGVTDRGELIRMIEGKRDEGVFLNIYGFGMGNLKDATLEQLANKGNGSYGYIDSFAEAQKVFGEQLSGTLVTVAKDVKFQIEFNPAQVAAWRQIGYENRQLAREDFNDDRKDAGEVGAGHTVTVLYEIVPAGVEPPVAPDEHRYLQENPKSKIQNPKSESSELLFLKIRYKEPKEEESKLLTFPVKDAGKEWKQASADFKFAAAVASFGMLLRESPYAGKANWDLVMALAQMGRGEDEHGHRAEFVRLAGMAFGLSKKE